MAGVKFASGKHAVAECPLCGHIVDYKDLAKDWRGVYVCSDCQDLPPTSTLRREVEPDPEGLHHAQPIQYTESPVVNLQFLPQSTPINPNGVGKLKSTFALGKPTISVT